MKYENNKNSNELFRIKAYSFTESVKKKLIRDLKIILKRYNNEKLFVSLYTCMEEFIENAVRANLKKIFFKDYSSKDVTGKKVNYETVLEQFKQEFRRDYGSYLKGIAKKNDINFEVSVAIETNNLVITVINPANMTEIEQNNVRKKIRDAGKYTGIAEYFNAIEDEPSEGAGLGLVMIMFILKNIGLSEKNFSIESSGCRTTASIWIPLKNNTITT
ncbi:MAG: hypothetical protein GY754_13175 [bacterium]|nr:hypothetical protein [bacterium]